MQNNREAGQTAGDLFENVKAQGRRNENTVSIAGALLGLELVSAVACADSDGQRVAAGLGDELLDLFGAGVGGLVCGDLHVVFDTGERSELGLDDHTVVMCVLDDLLRDFDVLSEGLGGRVDHDGGKAAVDTGLAGLKVGAVVQMQNDRNFGALDDSRLDELDEVGVVRVGTRTLRHL